MTISDWQDGNPPKSGWYPVLDKDGLPGAFYWSGQAWFEDDADMQPVPEAWLPMAFSREEAMLIALEHEPAPRMATVEHP